MYHYLALVQALYAVFAWSASSSAAQPIFGPIMLSPNASTIWTMGSVESVRWDNRGLDIPPNHHGSIVLGYYDPYSEEPDIGHNFLYEPLADGFLISDEVVNVVVPPNLPSGKYYYILLGGDAQNVTDVFAIKDPALPSTTATSLAFPASIAVSQAPSATASSWAPSSTPGITSPVTTTSSGTSTAATSGSPSSESSTSTPTRTTSEASFVGEEIGWARFAAPLLIASWILTSMT